MNSTRRERAYRSLRRLLPPRGERRIGRVGVGVLFAAAAAVLSVGAAALGVPGLSVTICGLTFLCYLLYVFFDQIASI